MLERDKLEFDEYWDYRSNFLNDINDSGHYDQIIGILEREIAQIRRKLSYARIEVGKSKAMIAERLESIRSSSLDKKDRKDMKEDVKRMKDDQRDVRKLERYFNTLVEVQNQFPLVMGEDPKRDEIQKLLEVMAETLRLDIQWTQKEIIEDKSDLKKL